VTDNRGTGRRFPWAIILALLAVPAIAALPGARAAFAQTPPPATPAPEPEKKTSPWSNSTELSLVWTAGNSDVQTLGFKNTLEHKHSGGRTRIRLDTLRSDTSDDPYLLVQPGLTFLPGETPTDFTTHEVRPGAEPDVARYFAEGRYEGNLSKEARWYAGATGATWNAGASWDRNEDAGILSRTIVFGGLGHAWRDRDDLKFRTTYGFSWTNRIEDVDDPAKDQRFAGLRLTSDFTDKWGANTTYDNDFTYNVSFRDLNDWNADLIQGVSVMMSKHLALKISLQLTYANEPALEDVDIIVRGQLVDPDGIPGSGDEFFETLDSGGTEITIGEGTLRREKLDSTFRTSLAITF
jgi:putative salt-induced outer membrane protein YdiY